MLLEQSGQDAATLLARTTLAKDKLLPWLQQRVAVERNDVRTGTMLLVLGRYQLVLGDTCTARASLARAAAMLGATLGPDHGKTALAQIMAMVVNKNHTVQIS